MNELPEQLQLFAWQGNAFTCSGADRHFWRPVQHLVHDFINTAVEVVSPSCFEQQRPFIESVALSGECQRPCDTEFTKSRT
jgi:hypothetical protein